MKAILQGLAVSLGLGVMSPVFIAMSMRSSAGPTLLAGSMIIAALLAMALAVFFRRLKKPRLFVIASLAICIVTYFTSFVGGLMICVFYAFMNLAG